MNKIIIALFLFPVLAFSFSKAENKAMKENIKVLESKGLITPDSGVELVPRAHLNNLKWQKEKDIIANNQQIQNGYYKEYSERAVELLNIKNIVKKRQLIDANKSKPYESHLRTNINDMKIAYIYSGVLKEDMTNFIGIAPVGMYTKEGWSGAVEFFENKEIGTCAFTENNLKISHGAAQVAEEDATYDVNGKITLIEITGIDVSGYLYKIKWFDKMFIRELECANKNYSPSITKQIISLAKRIDSNY